MRIRLRTDVNSVLWELIVFFSWIPAVAYTIGIQVLVSIGIYTTVVLMAVLFVWEVINKTKVKKHLFYIIVFFLIYALYAVIKIKILDKNGVKPLLYLGLMIMAFYMCFDDKMQCKVRHSLYLYPLLISFLMFAFSFNTSLYESYADGRYSLYLRYQNPNILSYVLLIMIIFLLLGFFDERKKMYLFAVGIDLYILYLTSSRSSIFAVAFLLFFVLLNRKPKKQKKIISIILSLIPGIFVGVVLMLGGMSISLMGKSGVSGRNVIWESVINLGKHDLGFLFIGKSEYMGELKIYEGGFSGMDVLNNSHNAFMQLFSNYGIIITCIFIICLCFVTVKTGERVFDRYTYTAYIGAIAILINCSFETHIVDAIIGMTFMWILLYKLVLSRRIGETIKIIE